MKIYTNEHPITLIKVVEFCSDYFHTPVKDIIGKNRKDEYVMCRHFSRYLSNKYLKKYYSLAVIGAVTGCDHATVLHSVKVVESLMETEGDKNSGWGSSFVLAHIHFRMNVLPSIISLAHKKVIQPSRFSNVVTREKRRVLRKEKTIADMYNEFLKFTRHFNILMERDRFLQEGYLKKRYKKEVNEVLDKMRTLKLNSNEI